MTIRRVDHTAIAVRDLEEALARYESLYATTCTDRMRVVDQAVDVAFLELGDTRLELVSPFHATSGVTRFLEKRGEGLHHIGIAVERLEDELERLQRAGIALIDQQPRQGAHGRVAFVHPSGTGGVLVELVERE